MEKTDYILEKFSQSQSKVFFVQIGAGDGIIHDPIRFFIKKYNWSGILIEPVPYVYNKLIEGYKENTSLVFENLAISEKAETRKFWHLHETDDALPEWYHLLGTFNKDVIVKHVDEIPTLYDHLVSTDITCITLEDLFQKHNVSEIDLLSIDTEGYDFEIIKQFDFSSFLPKIVIYEQIHLHPKDYLACQEYLKDLGYMIYEAQYNTVAYRIPVDI